MKANLLPQDTFRNIQYRSIFNFIKTYKMTTTSAIKTKPIHACELAVNEDEELEPLRADLAARGVTEADVREAVDWARENP